MVSIQHNYTGGEGTELVFIKLIIINSFVQSCRDVSLSGNRPDSGKFKITF